MKLNLVSGTQIYKRSEGAYSSGDSRLTDGAKAPSEGAWGRIHQRAAAQGAALIREHESIAREFAPGMKTKLLKRHF